MSKFAALFAACAIYATFALTMLNQAAQMV